MTFNPNVDKLVNRLFLWCMLSVVATIPLLLIGAVIAYFVYGCWPLRGDLTQNCLGTRAPMWVGAIPMVIGAAIGFVWSGKTNIKIPEL